MGKTSYPLSSSKTQDFMTFDLDSDHEHDQGYIDALYGNYGDEPEEKSSAEKMPEATEDRSY